MKWFISVLKHYANFSGQARRKELHDLPHRGGGNRMGIAYSEGWAIPTWRKKRIIFIGRLLYFVVMLLPPGLPIRYAASARGG
jgi:hypothetical protein